MKFSATAKPSFLGFGFFGNSTPTHLVEKGCFFYVCISWELAVHAAIGEVTDDAMGGTLDDGISILIISFSMTVPFDVYFAFRRCGISTIFLMLNFCAVGFYHKCVYFGSEAFVF